MAAFNNWREVLQAVLSDPPDTKDFYMIRVGEGDNQTRSRFMTRNETIEFVKREMRTT